MTHESLLNRDWNFVVDRLGGAAALETSARKSGAFRRARELKTAVDALRMVLALCLGKRSLRSTTAWAASVGLADISNVALLYRLRQCGDWLAMLVGEALAGAVPKAAQGRLIRIVDATTVPKAGRQAKKDNGVWRIHAAFDLPAERFGAFQLTDETEGETLDRIEAIEGEIRLADRAYLQPDRMAAVMEKGADLVVRTGWKGAHWLDGDGRPLDLIGLLRAAEPRGRIDRPIWLRRKSGPPLALRLVAVKKPPAACAEARRKARRQAQKEGYQVSKATLIAADWVILITSLTPQDYPTEDLLDLYRLRWRVELGFKRLKSQIGLRGPPGIDERSARPFILAHLLAILLLEPLIGEFEDSPRSARAAA